MADMTLKYLLLGEDKTASKAIKGVANTAEQSGSKFEGVSKAWAAGAAVAGAAFVKFGMDTVSAASDQNEVISKSSVIFGDQADAINEWASGASKNMGLSKTAALEAASGFGDMFLQLGFAGDESAKMSKAVVQMSADLGSFNNLPTAEVADMMSAAFRGEYDSLQRLVPNINAARVETEALAMTGKKSAKELTAQEKAAATLAIVTKDGARAVGDFARTSDGLANSTKILSAEFENAQAELGQKLLPVVNATVKGLTGMVGGVSSAVDTIAGLPPQVIAATAAFTAWHLVGDRVTGVAGRVSSAVRPVGENIRLAGMYAKDAGGGFRGLSAGFEALRGGASTGSVALSGLKSAAGGLLSMLGGPWGIALTGATVGLTAWITAQQNAKAAAETLAGTVDTVTGKFNDLSRTNVRDALMGDLSPEDAKLLSDIGISYTEGAEAMLAGGDKAEAYRAKIATLTAEYQRNGGMLDSTGRALEGYGNSLENQGEVVDAARAVTTVAARETEKYGDAAATAAPKVAAAASEADLFAGVVDAVGDAAGSAKVDLQGVNDELAEFYQVAVDARGASRDYQAAIDAASESVKENGRTLNIGTEAGRKNQAALDAIATSAIKSAEANLTNGRSQKAVTADVDKARAAFVTQATKMGLSKEAAGKLATQLGLTKDQVQLLTTKVNGIPAAKETKISTPGLPTAKTEVRTFTGLVNGVPQYKATTVSTPGSGTAKSEIRTFTGLINGVPTYKSVTISVSSNAWAAVASARSALSSIGSAAIGKNARGTSNWRGGLTWVGEEGPEIVNLPAGSAVYDARTSAAMSAGGGTPVGGGGGDVALTVNLRAPDGRVMQSELLRLKRTSGGSLGLG